MAIQLETYRLRGIEAEPVTMEVDIGPGMPVFSIVGMAGASVQEAKDRVRSAITASAFRFPLTRKIVNLAPAEVVKSGSHFDLPMALGLLLASGQMVNPGRRFLVLGELGLDGSVRRVKGVLAALLMARARGLLEVIIPRDNLGEALLVKGLKIFEVTHLKEAVAVLEGHRNEVAQNEHETSEEGFSENDSLFGGVDFADIAGHAAAKRALLVAAAGGHHILLSGPPGSGKSLLAEAFPGLLPPLTPEERIEVLQIHGAVNVEGPSSHGRPFRIVHPRTTSFMLLGGGSGLAPGEVSLAHRGVLMMDEFTEFERSVLESLRAPLEGRELHLRVGKENAIFPCRFQLLAACNPCPCGFYGDKERACHCSAAEIARYERKLSGPIVDRLDLCIDVPRLAYEDFKLSVLETSAILRERVEAARERQRARLKKHGLFVNQELTPKLIKTECLDLGSQEFLSHIVKSFRLSGRAVHRIMKVARTLADLEKSEWIGKAHLMEAAQYRLRTP